MNNSPHKPVLYKEIIHALQPKSSGLYIDGTVGAGGHARGILEASVPEGQLLGLDLDEQALALARKSLAPFGKRVTLVQASYSKLLDVMHVLGWVAVDGILLDLGVSSMQFDEIERGFSFRHEAPLDMRFDPSHGVPAAEMLNSIAESDLVDILFKFGEEPRARKIAKMIIEARPISTTTQLADVVKRAYPGHSRIHPATRTFQAIRISINEELSVLEQALPSALAALCSGGRLAIISFHSLEDRIVKDFIRTESHDEVNPAYEELYKIERRARLKEINRKPLTSDDDEIYQNPRARSAKLRIAEKLELENC